MANEDETKIPTLGELTEHEEAHLKHFIDILASLEEVDFDVVKRAYSRVPEDGEQNGMARAAKDALASCEILEGARRRIEEIGEA